MIITIDGPAGTGKSTVAKQLAKRLGFLYFDTGAMYRAFAWYILHKKIDIENEEALTKGLKSFSFSIAQKKGNRSYEVEGQDITESIRTQEITDLSSKIAALPTVRKSLISLQHSYAREQKDVVFEGRDMGSVVFPHADLKIFLTASPEIRAERRYLEWKKKFSGQNQFIDYHEILLEIKQRDLRDATRKISPMVRPKGSYLIDTSDLTLPQVLQKILSLHPQNAVQIGKLPVFSILFRKGKMFYKLILFLAASLLRLFYSHRVYGLEHFIKGGGIVAPNHTSHLDPPAVSVSCPEEVHFLAKDSLFKLPFLGWLIRKLNSHPVSREGSEVAALRVISSILEKGGKVLLFPEGTRSETGELKPLEKGAAFLAYRTKCSILPVYVQGTFSIWPKERKFPKLFGKTLCAFGSPIVPEKFIDLPRKEAMEFISKELTKSLEELKTWVEKGAKGSPP